MGCFIWEPSLLSEKKKKKRKKKGKKRKEKERKTDYLKINSNKLVWQVTPYEVFTK